MKTRRTSIDCYNQIKEEGLLSKMRLQVYKELIDIAPCTAGELQDHINNKNCGIKHSWKLLSILRDSGAIFESGERKCKITGINVIEWDITGILPVKTIITKSNKPNSLKKCIKHILKKMGEDGIMFVDQDYLNNLI